MSKRDASPDVIDLSSSPKRRDVGQMECGRAEGGLAPTSLTWPDSPFHLMRVRDLAPWANQGSLGMKLGDVVAGPIRWALVSNYMLDFAWLLSACPDLAGAQRLILVHGEGHERAAAVVRDVAAAGLAHKTTVHLPPLPIPYGTHHSKAFLLKYDHGLRLVVHTANLIYPDCNNKSQAVYTQDFPPTPEPKEGHFQQCLASYMRALRLPPTSSQTVQSALREHDFSCARVALVASIPGYHKLEAQASQWGHLSLRQELKREAAFDPGMAGTPMLAQFSSLGAVDTLWLEEELGMSANQGSCRGPEGGKAGLLGPAPGLTTLVWPTVSEVQNSVEGWLAGRSIPGPSKNVSKPFLAAQWHRWGGEPVGRQRAMPHIKTYCRFHAESGAVPWFLTASHNLSKAAWGVLQKKQTQLMIRSYEVGALHLPSLEAAYLASPWRGYDAVFGRCRLGPLSGTVPERVRFRAWGRGQSFEPWVDASGLTIVPLPIPYTLPPAKYVKSSDVPWAVDFPWPGLDHWGATVEAPYGAFYGLTEDMEWGDLGRG